MQTFCSGSKEAQTWQTLTWHETPNQPGPGLVDKMLQRNFQDF